MEADFFELGCLCGQIAIPTLQLGLILLQILLAETHFLLHFHDRRQLSSSCAMREPSYYPTGCQPGDQLAIATVVTTLVYLLHLPRMHYSIGACSAPDLQGCCITLRRRRYPSRSPFPCKASFCIQPPQHWPSSCQCLARRRQTIVKNPLISGPRPRKMAPLPKLRPPLPRCSPVLRLCSSSCSTCGPSYLV